MSNILLFKDKFETDKVTKTTLKKFYTKFIQVNMYKTNILQIYMILLFILTDGFKIES